ncbi:MAG: hypothetical protein AB1916_11040 [Thermodesulfobacteriota bacterium]
MTASRDAASSSDDPAAEMAALSAEAEELSARQKEVAAQIRRLRETEDLAAGKVYAQEIFALQQEKMRLEVEIHLRRSKVNRIRISLDPGLLH